MHVDAVGRQRDEDARRYRALVDERDRPDARIDDGVPDRDRRVEASAERVDLVNDEIEAALVRLPRGALDERRDTELDLVPDRNDHDLLRRRGGTRRQGRECERRERDSKDSIVHSITPGNTLGALRGGVKPKSRRLGGNLLLDCRTYPIRIKGCMGL